MPRHRIQQIVVCRHVGAVTDLIVELIAKLQQWLGVAKCGFFKKFQGTFRVGATDSDVSVIAGVYEVVGMYRARDSSVPASAGVSLAK